MTERAEIMAVARGAKRTENTRCEINILQSRKDGEVEMTNLDGLWLAIFIMTIVSVSVIVVLFTITWGKIDLIYDIVRKERR